MRASFAEKNSPRSVQLKLASGDRWNLWKWGDCSAGLVGVALHGFSGTGLDWELPVEAFGQRIGAWIAPDLPGHGGSIALSASKAYSLEGIADGLDALIAGLRQPPVLFGYSMGGRAALTYAMRGRNSLAALVLIGASPGIPDLHQRELRRASDEALASRIGSDGIAAFADYWENLPLLRSQNLIASPWRERLRDRRRGQEAAELAHALRNAGTATMIPKLEMLVRVRCPILWVAGADDRKFAEIAVSAAGEMRDAQSVLIEGAGHAPHLESPFQFCKSVGNYLRKL